MYSHTGGCMTLGKGSIYSSSTKQKLNGKSSIEAEIIGIDDVMPQITWTQYFLEAQGFQVNNNIVYKDNQSTMQLAKQQNQIKWKTNKTYKYKIFFVTDKIKSGEVNVEYCPTEMMVADFYTKTLQGKLFRIFINMILNINDPDIDTYVRSTYAKSKHKMVGLVTEPTLTEPQECVEHNKKIVISKMQDIDMLKIFKDLTHMYSDTRDIVTSKKPRLMAKLRELAKIYFSALGNCS